MDDSMCCKPWKIGSFCLLSGELINTLNPFVLQSYFCKQHAQVQPGEVFLAASQDR